jgi:hypothetical protein
MQTPTLRDFMQTALRDKRIRFGEVRRLQRNVLPDGIVSRDEAEALLALDRSIAKPDPAWTEFLVSAVRTFLVDGSDPIGVVDAEKSVWFVAAVGTPPTKTGIAIAREVLVEADEVDSALADLANGATRPRPFVSSPTLQVELAEQAEPLAAE